MITESWLTSDMLNPEICVEGYNVFRSDRASRIGGGVCVYMRNDLTVTKELSFSNDMVEIIMVKIEELKGIVIGVYRPPNTNKDKWDEALTELKECLNNIQSKSDKYVNIWTFGDFNFPGVDWISDECSSQALA